MAKKTKTQRTPAAQRKHEQKQAAAAFSVEGRKRKRAERWEKVTPARGQRTVAKRAGGTVLEDCDRRGCRVPDKQRALEELDGFNYTTPSVRKAQNEPGYSSGALCATMKPTKKQRAEGKWKPPACPTNLVFIKGQTYLRLCREYNKPGYIVPVRNAQHAARVGAKLCACRKKQGTWDKCVTPDTKTKVSSLALSGLKRRRRR